MKPISLAILALFIAVAPALVVPALAEVSRVPGSYMTAQGGTCRSFQDTCAARCLARVPDDKNCVSDHCTPKLAECRKTGCWQEGNLYGGAKTCNLAR
jgi:hypothetical protein